MQIKYSFDESQKIYVAGGEYQTNSHLKSFVADGNTFAELEENVRASIECLWADEAEEFAAIQESQGSFSKFVYPKGIFEKVELSEFYDDIED